jgi:hypothetical protein
MRAGMGGLWRWIILLLGFGVIQNILELFDLKDVSIPRKPVKSIPSRTSSPRLAQSRLLTYRLLPSSITSLPNSFSNFPVFSFVGSFSNGQPPFGSLDSAGAGPGGGAVAVVAVLAALGTADGIPDDEG